MSSDTPRTDWAWHIENPESKCGSIVLDDERYITSEKLERELNAANKELAADCERLTKENEKLRAELADCRAHAGDFASEVVTYKHQLKHKQIIFYAGPDGIATRGMTRKETR